MLAMGGVAHTAVVLYFPDSTEVRYLVQAPRRGQRVASRSGDVWFVSHVARSGTRMYTVTCVARRDFLRELRRRRSSDMASDLLALARRTIRAREGVAKEPVYDPRGFNRRSEGDWIEKYLEVTLQGLSRLPAYEASPGSKPASDWIEEYLATTFAPTSPRQRGRWLSLLSEGKGDRERT